MSRSARDQPTRTAPESIVGSTYHGPNVVTALALGTGMTYPLSRDKGCFVIGSDPKCDIVLDKNGYVSAHHCRLERTGDNLRVVDLSSKNGTHFEGMRESSFTLTPGKSFIVGVLQYRFVALDDDMMRCLPDLSDIAGTDDEHVIQNADDKRPTPLNIIQASDQSFIIVSEAYCRQDFLACIMHGMSKLRQRDAVLLDAAPLSDTGQRNLSRGEREERARAKAHRTSLKAYLDLTKIKVKIVDGVPSDRKELAQLIKRDASRSTLILDLKDDASPLDPTFVSMLLSPSYQVRVLILASHEDVATKALGARQAATIRTVWLPPLGVRTGAIHRLLDRAWSRRESSLRVEHLTQHNQQRLRSYGWPHNFSSIEDVAKRLDLLFRTGESTTEVAALLDMPTSTFSYWFLNHMELSHPLANIRLARD